MEEILCGDHNRNQPSCRKLEVYFRGSHLSGLFILTMFIGDLCLLVMSGDY